MKFALSFSWSYDPLGVISKLGLENKFTPYHHTTRPEIEQFKNQLEWTENTLQEAKEQVVSTSNMQTPIAQEKTAKRGREEQSSLVTKATSQGFKVFDRKKKQRVSMNVDSLSREQSIQSPTQSTTSHEQQIVQHVGGITENKEEDR